MSPDRAMLLEMIVQTVDDGRAAAAGGGVVRIWLQSRLEELY